jgi:phosphotriesterase-related protein
MTKVMTVAGPVDVEDLGITYMHEHIFLVSPEVQHYWPGAQGWNEEVMVARAREALTVLHRDYGVQTILDPTVPGLGRNIRAVRAAAEGTGLNVIAATGWYTYRDLPFALFAFDPTEKSTTLERLFLRDIEYGLEGTDVRPGVIKCAIDQYGLTPDIEVTLRAAARAHVASGLPITTHTDPSIRGGLIQQDIFADEGVDLEAVVIGHCNWSADLSYLEQLIDNGSYIGFDRCGMAGPEVDLAAQLDNLVELCARGYATRIVLSHDQGVYVPMIPDWILDMIPDGRYGYLHSSLLPALRRRGVGEAEIQSMLVENPRAYFSRSA